MDFTNLISFLPASPLRFLKFLIFLVLFDEAKWLLPPGEYLILPLLVILNLFATPLFVFNFGMLFSLALMGISAQDSPPGEHLPHSKKGKVLDRAQSIIIPYLGAITKDIILPSNEGVFSTNPSP